MKFLHVSRKGDVGVSKIFSISVPKQYEYLIEIFNEEARRLGISRSQLIMQILAEYYEKKKRKEPITDIKELKKRVKMLSMKLDVYLGYYRKGLLDEKRMKEVKEELEYAKNLYSSIMENENWFREIKKDEESSVDFVVLEEVIEDWNRILGKTVMV